MDLWGTMYEWFGGLPVWAKVFVLGVLVCSLFPYCVSLAYYVGGIT